MSKVLVTGGAGYIGAHVAAELLKSGYSIRIYDDFSNGLHRRVDGKRVEELPASQSDFHHAKPIYEYLPGWSEDISKARELSDLPKNAKSYIKFLEEISGAPMSAIGVGPGRDETISIRELI